MLLYILFDNLKDTEIEKEIVGKVYVYVTERYVNVLLFLKHIINGQLSRNTIFVFISQFKRDKKYLLLFVSWASYKGGKLGQFQQISKQ